MKNVKLDLEANEITTLCLLRINQEVLVFLPMWCLMVKVDTNHKASILFLKSSLGF